FKQARIGAELAKKGTRNEGIMKKSLEANSVIYAYALKEWCIHTLQHRSNSEPDLLLFDPEIERTLRRARQVTRRLEFENNSRSQTIKLASENNSVYSSDTDTDFELSTSFDTGISIM
ncbi:hypothetical protein PIB30_056841, partial [Stylosanthes scabra]|nr:hypothetical protein [Stylosanthes scabra]